MKQTRLVREQLDRKIAKLNVLDDLVIPPNGWIYSFRQGLNMSLRQLGNRLSITPQSIKEIEEREKSGTISLKVLRQVAAALHMKFVYGFIPDDQSLENMVHIRATEIARQIVQRTSINMSLEDQKNSEDRLNQAIKEKAEEIANKIPGYIWD